MVDRAVLALQVGGDGIFRIGAGERETVAGQIVLRERLPSAAAQRLDRYGVRPGQRQGKQELHLLRAVAIVVIAPVLRLQ